MLYRFVRFSSVQAAQKAIDLFHKKTINKVSYRVKPAYPKEVTTSNQTDISSSKSVPEMNSSFFFDNSEVSICYGSSIDDDVNEERFENSDKFLDDSLTISNLLLFPFMDPALNSQLLMKCNGGLQLEDRIGSFNDNHCIKITSAKSISHCWIQVLDSPLVS